MCNSIHPSSSLYVRTLRTWSIIVLVTVVAVFYLIVPFGRTYAVGKQSFTPTADTFIDGNEPNKNFGKDSSIFVKNNPPMAGLLRFAVTGAPENTPVSAQLRLFVTDGSNGIAATVYVFPTSAKWEEDQMTWNSQLAFGNQAGASRVQQLVEGQWVEINLGPIINGDGVYSFALTSDTPDRVAFAARTEANPVQLVIGISGNTPVPTQTPTTFTTGTVTLTDGTLPLTDQTIIPTDATALTDETVMPTDATTIPEDMTATPTATSTHPMSLSNHQKRIAP